MKNLFSQLRTRRRGVILVAACGLLIGILLVIQLLLASWTKGQLVQVLDEYGLSYEVDKLAFNLAGASVKLNVKGLNISEKQFDSDFLLQDTDFTARVRWADILTGNLRVDDVLIRNMRINALVARDGRMALKELIQRVIADRDPDTPPVQVGKVEVLDLIVEYDNEPLEHVGLLTGAGDLLTSEAAGVSQFVLEGDINYLPVVVTVERRSDESADAMSAQHGMVVNLEFAELQANLSIDVDSLFEPTAGLLSINAQGSQISSLITTLGLGLTPLSEASLFTEIMFDENGFVTNSLDLRLDRSDLSGSLQWLNADTAESYAKLEGTFSADSIYIDEFVWTAPAKSDDGKGLIESADQILENDGHSDNGIPYLSEIERVDIDLSAMFKSIYRGSLAVKGSSLTLNKSGQDMSMTFDSRDFGRGEFNSEVSLGIVDHGLSGSGSVQLKRASFSDLLSAASLPDSLVTGFLSGNGKFWIEGDTPADLVASLDGGMFAILEDGKLDSLLVEMAGIDFMETINLVVKQDIQQTEVRCGYMDIQAIKGVLSIDDFIIDTEDSVFLLTGDIDLVRQLMDLRFTPLPRDASFLAATTPVNISGPLSSPRTRPGRKLYARVALAAAMTAMAGPAAVVLPFIAIGNGESESHCADLFSG